MARYLFALALGLSLTLCRFAYADDVDALVATMAEFDQLQGAFEQTQFDEEGAELAVSTGRFKLLRPGYFTWDVQSPDSQLVVANPQYIWHFDRDLETVTRRPVSDEAGMAPLQVLGGDVAALRANFSVTRNDDDSFLLQPLSGQDGFRELTLMVTEEELFRMEILDTLGQRIVIELSGLDRDSTLSAEDFSFTPPVGVDLFYHDQ